MRFLTALALVLGTALIPIGCTKATRTTRQEFQPRKVRPVDAETAPFIAGKRNKVFHTRHCPYAANLESLIGYSTVRDAELSGYIACEFCMPGNAVLPEAPAETSKR